VLFSLSMIGLAAALPVTETYLATDKLRYGREIIWITQLNLSTMLLIDYFINTIGLCLPLRKFGIKG
jgi:hypothetical protein